MEEAHAAEIRSAFIRAYTEATGDDLPYAAAKLLEEWLEGFIGGGDERDERDLYEIEVFDGVPTLLLIGVGGIRFITLEVGEPNQIKTRYLPAPLGGAYTETWRMVDGPTVRARLCVRARIAPWPARIQCRHLARNQERRRKQGAGLASGVGRESPPSRVSVRREDVSDVLTNLRPRCLMTRSVTGT
jgi:hypothetical protein